MKAGAVVIVSPSEVSAEILETGLYTPGFVGETCFRGEREIHRLAYEPGIGWAMIHQYIRGEPAVLVSVYVDPSHRRQGHGTRLLSEVVEGYPGRLSHGRGLPGTSEFFAAFSKRNQDDKPSC